MRSAASIPLLIVTLLTAPSPAAAQGPETMQFRVLATSRTSTMAKELNAAAEVGYRFASVMGGETAGGGKEVVVILERDKEATARSDYRLLATSKTSTLEKKCRPRASAQ